MQKDKPAQMFAVTEEDREGDTWVESLWCYRSLAEHHAAKLQVKNGSLAMVTEMAWDEDRACYRVPLSE